MGTTAKSRRGTSTLAFIVCVLFSAVAAADAPQDEGQSISVGERAEAAEAYDRGTTAYLSEQYELAAHWFERAYRVVPTSTALVQAVRAHHKAGNSIRAAWLYWRVYCVSAGSLLKKKINRSSEFLATVHCLI